MMAVIIVTHFLPKNLYARISNAFIKSPLIIKLAVFIIVVQLVIEFMSEDVAPFIYFQF